MLVDLADVLRAAGLDVVERSGWRERGHGDMGEVRAIVLHHTAGSARGDAPSLPTVEGGRPDLRGPLAHLLLDRAGRWHVVAAGLCWHTGLTLETWQSNAHAIGIEGEATGVDVWPAVQYASYVRGARALADHYRVPYARVLGHREVARPQGRKVDPNFDMAAFRAALAMKEDDVPLSDTDVERIARRAAELVWARPTLNAKGERPPAEAILAAAEGRAWDVQDRVYEIRDEVRRLGDTHDGLTTVDLDTLAEKVVERIAARLRGA